MYVTLYIACVHTGSDESTQCRAGGLSESGYSVIFIILWLKAPIKPKSNHGLTGLGSFPSPPMVLLISGSCCIELTFCVFNSSSSHWLSKTP